MVVERESAIEQMREEAKRNSDKTEQLEAEVKLLKEKNKKLNVENEQMSRGTVEREILRVLIFTVFVDRGVSAKIKPTNFLTCLFGCALGLEQPQKLNRETVF